MSAELLLLHAHVRIRDLEHALAAERRRVSSLKHACRLLATQRDDVTDRMVAYATLGNAYQGDAKWLDRALAHARRCARAWKRLAKRERTIATEACTALDLVAGALTDAATVPVPADNERLCEGVRALTRQRDAALDERDKAEQERDEARRLLALSMAGIFRPDAHNWAATEWGADVAAWLFPVAKGDDDGR